jgi:hypothetical protein
MAASEKITGIKSRGTAWILSVLTLTSLFVLFVLSQWWGREPVQFNILEEAILQANPEAIKTEHVSAEESEEGATPSYEALAVDLPLGIPIQVPYRISQTYCCIKAVDILRMTSHLRVCCLITLLAGNLVRW